MYIPVHSPWLPGYIDVMQTAFTVLIMAGLFLNRFENIYIYIHTHIYTHIHIYFPNLPRIIYTHTHIYTQT